VSGSNGSNGGFLKSAALLTGIIVGTGSLLLLVVAPLYTAGPLSSWVDTNSEQTARVEQALSEAQRAICSLHRVVERVAAVSRDHPPANRILLEEAQASGAGCPPAYHYNHP
jgi:hypothetical protein